VFGDKLTDGLKEQMVVDGEVFEQDVPVPLDCSVADVLDKVVGDPIGCGCSCEFQPV